MIVDIGYLRQRNRSAAATAQCHPYNSRTNMTGEEEKEEEEEEAAERAGGRASGRTEGSPPLFSFINPAAAGPREPHTVMWGVHSLDRGAGTARTGGAITLAQSGTCSHTQPRERLFTMEPGGGGKVPDQITGTMPP